jgi:hypothetical protein
MAQYIPTHDYRANVRVILQAATTEQWEVGMSWYRTAHDYADAIATATGLPLDAIAAAMAALSPRNRWRSNVIGTMSVARYVAGLTDNLPYCGTFNSNRDKAVNILRNPSQWADILRGIKVNSFVRNIALLDYSCATIDVWAVRAATNGERDAVKTDTDYRAIEAAYIEVANEFGISPAQAQAIAWSVVNPASVKVAHETIEF